MAATQFNPICIDLWTTLAADTYRLEWDPAYHVERSDIRAKEAAWLTRIPCRRGFIFPWGGPLLAAWGAMSGSKQDDLCAIPDVRVRAGGLIQGRRCAEIIVTFPVERLDEVAALLGAKRRRTLSPANREAAIERLARYRFTKSEPPQENEPPAR